MRWTWPGPQEPAQTASLPESWLSAPAAKAATSSWRTWIQSMVPRARSDSVSAFRLSPTMP